MMMEDIPVLLLNFNRPDLTTGLIENLRQVRPRKVYIAIDGPRAGNAEDARNCALSAQAIALIDWPCEVRTKISPVNLGLRRNVKGAIDWLFSENEVGIILEDDIRFGPGFFAYCQRMLEAYRDDPRVGVISGNNLVRHLPGYPATDDANFLCSIFHCWGWATWRDRWAIYDDNIEEDEAFFRDRYPSLQRNGQVQNFWRRVRLSLQQGAVNSWAWRMQLSMFRAERLCMTPSTNLTVNIGFGEEATHTTSKPAWMEGWEVQSYDSTAPLPAELRENAAFNQFENRFILGAGATRSLDLGCGPSPKNTCGADEVYGIDLKADEANRIYAVDLAIAQIPFADESFEFVTAHDFLKHIPHLLYTPARRLPFVELMNEIYRVLKTGGTFLSFTPAYPHAEALRDPSCVNVITEQTFTGYFDDTNRWAAADGFKGAFSITSQEWRGPHLLTLLRKVAVPEQAA